MKSKILLLILPVLLLTAVSGCTSGGNTLSVGPGLVIEAFEPDFPQVYGGETVQLRALIRNKGSVDAIGVSAAVSGTSWIPSACTGNCENQRLLPSAPDKGIEGEVLTCSWNCKVPNNLPEGVSLTYYPIINAYYKYSITTVKSVTIGSSTELRRIQNTGGVLPSETVSSTSGPVSIDITLKGPLRFSTDSGSNSIQFPVEIKVTNTGGGVVCKDSCGAGGSYGSGGNSGSEDWNKINLHISSEEPLSITCGSSGSNDVELALWRGQSNMISCRASIASATSMITQALVTVSANYGYRVDKSASLVVTGTTQGSQNMPY
jgi:hypothetical protein